MGHVAAKHDGRFLKRPSNTLMVKSMIHPTQLHVDLKSEVGEELELSFVLSDLLRVAADGMHVQSEVAKGFKTRIDELVSIAEHDEDDRRFRADASERVPNRFDGLLSEWISGLVLRGKGDGSHGGIREDGHPTPIAYGSKAVQDVDEVGIMRSEEIAPSSIPNNQYGPILQRLRINKLNLPQIPTRPIIHSDLSPSVHDRRWG